MRNEKSKIKNTNSQNFYSGWKAVVIGLISLVGLTTGILLFFPEPNFDTEFYDQKVVEFTRNEENALRLFSILENGEEEKALNFIDNSGIVLWEKNLSILEEMDNISGLDQEYKEQNEILREYCYLRIESYQLIKKSIIEGLPDPELDIINALIDKNFEEW